MPDRSIYAVFLHQAALDALGTSIKPYVIESSAGPHLQCAEIDSGGALFEMTLIGRDNEGRSVEVELMVPIGMVKLVISVRKDGEFGFNAHHSDETPAAAGTGPAPSTVAPGAAAT